jgi:hypothetical protein
MGVQEDVIPRYLRLARPYLVLLAIVAAGRWLLSIKGVPYETGTDKMSIVVLTLFASIYYGAFGRRWQRFMLLQAVAMGATLAFLAELTILLSTLASYLLGMDTYFNHPRALNVAGPIPLAQAMVLRLQGMVSNIVFNGIMGMLGWALGALLPSDPK